MRAHSTEQEIWSEQTLKKHHGKIFNRDEKKGWERDGDTETNESHQKVKTKKYDDAYVALDFTVTTVEFMHFKSLQTKKQF